MDNQNIDWSDAVFGHVPDEYKDWFLQESGTYWNDYKHKWLVNGRDKVSGDVEVTNRAGGKEVKNVEMYRANRFQNEMLTAKENIRGQVQGGRYIISNKNAFDLMVHGETEIEVEQGGQKLIQKIKIDFM